MIFLLSEFGHGNCVSVCALALFVLVVLSQDADGLQEASSGECDSKLLPADCYDPQSEPGFWEELLWMMCQLFKNDGDGKCTVVEDAGDNFKQAITDLLQNAAFSGALWETCLTGRIASIRALQVLHPEFMLPVVSLQSPPGQRTVKINLRPPLHLQEHAYFADYELIVEPFTDLTPFPFSSAWLSSQVRWHNLQFQAPLQEPRRCHQEDLPADCLPGPDGVFLLGVDWTSFLQESCRLCGLSSCYESSMFLKMAKEVLRAAWNLRRDAEDPSIPCAAGYFTALLFLSKHATFYGSSFRMVRAKQAAYQNASKGRVDFMQVAITLPVKLGGAGSILENYDSLPWDTNDQNGFSLIEHTFITSSLDPFPLHLHFSLGSQIFRSVQNLLTPEFSGISALVGQHLSEEGVSYFFMPGDASAERLKMDAAFTGSEKSQSQAVSIFVPVELSKRVRSLFRSFHGQSANDALEGRLHVVELSGMIQVGIEPFEISSSSLPFRVFCEECLYVSVYFYATASELGWILPLSYWNPCFIPTSLVFPLKSEAPHISLPVAAQITEKGVVLDYGTIPEAGMPRLGADIGACRSQLIELQDLRPGERSWLPDVLPEFNLGGVVSQNLDAVDLKMLRQTSKQVGLLKFLDKIKLKAWCKEKQIPVPTIYHVSNDSPDIPSYVLSMDSYVAKPAHLADASYVFVMNRGINLVNNRATTPEEVQEGLRHAFSTVNKNDWATEHSSPGVMVEELIQPSSSKAVRTPDELKCHAVWGELLFCQWVWLADMDSDLSIVEASEDWPLNQGHVDCGVPAFEALGHVFRDGSCSLCNRAVPVDWEATRALVERVAVGSDYLRVDVFIKDGLPVLNEVTITFAAEMGFAEPLAKELARRWLEGYAFRSSR